jgi:hypothetical protein
MRSIADACSPFATHQLNDIALGLQYRASSSLLPDFKKKMPVQSTVNQLSMVTLQGYVSYKIRLYYSHADSLVKCTGWWQWSGMSC